MYSICSNPWVAKLCWSREGGLKNFLNCPYISMDSYRSKGTI